MIRTNVAFMLTDIKNRGKIIFVSSAIPGEGKTFIALNMATTLAMSNKKVLVIGADIRKPKFESYLKHKFNNNLLFGVGFRNTIRHTLNNNVPFGYQGNIRFLSSSKKHKLFTSKTFRR